MSPCFHSSLSRRPCKWSLSSQIRDDELWPCAQPAPVLGGWVGEGLRVPSFRNQPQSWGPNSSHHIRTKNPPITSSTRGITKVWGALPDIGTKTPIFISSRATALNRRVTKEAPCMTKRHTEQGSSSSARRGMLLNRNGIQPHTH